MTEHRQRWLRPGALRSMRPSAHHHQTVAFYRDLAGLPVIENFAGSYGEDGTIFALPGAGTQLKVVRSRHRPPAGPVPPAPVLPGRPRRGNGRHHTAARSRARSRLCPAPAPGGKRYPGLPQPDGRAVVYAHESSAATQTLSYVAGSSAATGRRSARAGAS
jgi:hypothetical protein